MFIKGLENTTHGEMLREWALFGLKRRQQKGDHVVV